jgi:DNA-binding winged helix-turn-helix (wHTH) protein
MVRFRFDRFDVDPQAGEIRCEGKIVELQNQPFQLLLALIEKAGTLVTREELRRRIWPAGVHLNFDHSLNRSINKLREVLGDAADNSRFIETLPGRGYRFKGTLCARPPSGPAETNIIHLNSAVPPNSLFYVSRDADGQFRRALAGRESTILLTGPRQSGKTSLFARGLENVRSHGDLAVATDLAKLNPAQLCSAPEFASALAEELAHKMNSSSPDDVWNERRSASVNLDRYLKYVLAKIDQHVVWAIDEADRLFATSFFNEFFALVRSWHNERALEPDSPIQKLTVAVAYAREAHLFISDENQSPFNVGTKITMVDFTLDDVADLNKKYQSPLDHGQVRRLHKYTGGHPLLTHTSLQAIALGDYSFEDLLETGSLHDGPFGDHLRRLIKSFRRNPEFMEALESILNDGSLSPKLIYELRAAGVLSANDVSSPRLRCQIYEEFLKRELQ